MTAPSLARLLGSFSRQSRDLVQRYLPAALGRDKGRDRCAELEALAHALLSSRGEASGVALASDLLASYGEASEEERDLFFAGLATGFDPDPQALAAAWTDYARDGATALPALARAIESPRQELLRRMNLAPGGTAGLVAMRSRSAATARPCTTRRLRVGAASTPTSGHLLRKAGSTAASSTLGAIELAARRPAVLERLIALRSGARDEGLGGSAAAHRCARPALLRFLPSGAARRAADLRRGRAGGGAWPTAMCRRCSHAETR
jgi:hypothetical protein